MIIRVNTEQLDHLGIILSVIKDLSLIEFIDSRIANDIREKISCGETVACMIHEWFGIFLSSPNMQVIGSPLQVPGGHTLLNSYKNTLLTDLNEWYAEGSE